MDALTGDRGLREGDLRDRAARRAARRPRTRSPSASASPPRRLRGWSSAWASWAWSATCPTRASSSPTTASAWRSRSSATTGCSSSTSPSRSTCRGTASTPRPRCSSTSSRRSSRSSSRPSSAIPPSIRTATRSRRADLVIEERPTSALADLAPGTRATFVRISDSDPEMLRYLADRGIAPGDDFEVIDKQPFDGPTFARFGDDVHVLGGALARAMRARGELREPHRRRSTTLAARATQPPAAESLAVAAGAGAARSPCSGRRSSPASPTSTRATSRRTSPAAPSTATCCCGSCSPPT